MTSTPSPCPPFSRYSSENILVHEFGHTVMNIGLTEGDRQAIRRHYATALQGGSYDKGGRAACSLSPCLGLPRWRWQPVPKMQRVGAGRRQGQLVARWGRAL